MNLFKIIENKANECSNELLYICNNGSEIIKEASNRHTVDIANDNFFYFLSIYQFDIYFCVNINMYVEQK